VGVRGAKFDGRTVEQYDIGVYNIPIQTDPQEEKTGETADINGSAIADEFLARDIIDINSRQLAT
jgi:hypothetical protein